MIACVKNHVVYALFIPVLLLAAGCGAGNTKRDPSQQIAGASEENTPAEGLSPEEQALDPVKANIEARRHVNPSPGAPSAGYHVSPDDPGGRKDPKKNFRGPKLEPQMAHASEDSAAQVPIAKQKPLPPYIPPRLPARAQQSPPGPPLAPEPGFDDVGQSPEQSPAQNQLQKPAQQAPVLTPAVLPVLATVNVTGLRTGNHPGKARIVLDVSAATHYTSRLSEDGRALFVDITGAGWSGAPSGTAGNSMVRSYRATAGAAGGTLLVIDLARPSQLVASMALPPNEIYGHRLVFDIAPR